MADNESLEELHAFLKKAMAHCYAGKGRSVKNPERKGFTEFEFDLGDWYYRDSFTGWNKSWGTELVRYQDKPVWICQYGGGVIEEDNREQTRFIFKILKQVLLQDTDQARSARGPAKLKLGHWTYTYNPEGDIDNFHGLEEIKYYGKLKFYHRTIGGLVVYKKPLEF